MFVNLISRRMHRLALLCLLCTISYLHAYVVAPRELVKRATDQEIIDRINAEGNLTFSRVIRASAKERRKFVDRSNCSVIGSRCSTF